MASRRPNLSYDPPVSAPLDGMFVGEDVVDAGVTGADPRFHRNSR